MFLSYPWRVPTVFILYLGILDGKQFIPFASLFDALCLNAEFLIFYMGGAC